MYRLATIQNVTDDDDRQTTCRDIGSTFTKYGRPKSSVFSLLQNTVSDGNAGTDSGRLLQTDAAAAGKARSPMVARSVHGATMADVLEERSRRCACIGVRDALEI